MCEKTVLVSGIPESITEDDLLIYFQSRKKSNGGDIEIIEYTQYTGTAKIIFIEEKVAKKVLVKKHVLKDRPLTVKMARDQEEEMSGDIGSTLVLVSGISSRTTEDALKNYFENTRRSSGGDVKEVKLIDGDGSGRAIVTFDSAEIAKRVLEWGKHKLDDHPLTVTKIQQDRPKKTTLTAAQDPATEERSCVVRITGISNKTTKDALLNFFENKRRSGGGEIADIQYIPEECLADITFMSAEDAERVSPQKNLVLDGAKLTPILKELPKVLPKDEYKLHVMGISDTTTKDGLLSFMEVASGEEVESILFGSNCNAMVTFEEPPDLQKILKKCSTRALDGSHVTIEQVSICYCIEVTGLGPKTTHDTILFYFENPRQSGGGNVKKVQYVDEETTALVSFEEPSVVDKVVHREHIINGSTVIVAPHYPFLGEISENPGGGKKEKQLKVDPQTMPFIKKFFDQEFQDLLQETRVKFTWEAGSEDFVLSSMDNKIEKTKWEDSFRTIEGYIHQIITRKIEVSQETFKELIGQAHQKCLSFKDRVDIECKEKKGLIILRGKKQDVEPLAEQLDDLSEEINKEIEYEKAKITEAFELSKQQFDLLSFMNFVENLKKQFKDLEATMVKKELKLHFKGPDQVVREGNTAVWKALSKLKEHDMELPKSIVSILASNAGNVFLSKEFKRNQIDAVVSFEASDNTKVLVTAADREDTKKAMQLIEQATAEEYVHLEQDQTPLTQSEMWEKLMNSYQNSMLLKVNTELASNTVWIAGIKDEVDKAKEQIVTFFEKNSIINKFVETNAGRKKVLLRYESVAIKNIEESLKDQSVHITLDDDEEGISIRGTREGTQKAVQKVQNLVDQVKERSIDLHKPGMKKLFSENKGMKLLSIVENDHNCIIESCTPEQDKKRSIMATETGKNLSKQICSYVTPEGKIIILFKGDLTEHKVDVMVNAANQRLQHVGGLAKAIVQKGGQEIQTECDDFVLRNGRVLDGDVVVSRPGKLPCQRLVHAVGPMWPHTRSSTRYSGDNETKAQLILSQTVSNALGEAKGFRSIALPAISAGIFGFPADICAKTIVDSVLEYSEENANSKLTEIHIVDMNDDVIKAFTKEMTSRFSKEGSFTDSVVTPKKESVKARGKIRGKGKSASTVKDEQLSRRASSPTFDDSLSSVQGMKIDVIKSDLAKEEAHAIVNTVSSDLDLSKNLCAKALSQAAGPGLQQECKGKGPLKAGDMVVTEGYSLGCKNVFHVVAGGWENGKGEQMLRSLINTCLQEAGKRGFSSIAFPAIGTGNLGFPRDIVARVFFEEVDTFKNKHPQTSVLEVHFVLYHKDTPTIQAFENEQKNREKPKKGKRRSFLKTEEIEKSKSPRFDTDDLTNAQIGSIRVELVSGDITQEDVDAIVTPSNISLDLSLGGGVGAAIARVGGTSIQDECKTLGKQKAGSVVWTSAGNLPSQNIFHLVSASYKPDDVTDVVAKCFKKAESQRISSIAVPAIGTGNANISPKEAAKALLKAVQKFCKTEPLSVKLIRIVVFQEHMLQDFYAAIEDLAKTEFSSGGFWSWLMKSVMNIWSSGGSTPTSHRSLSSEAAMYQIAGDGGVAYSLHGKMWLMVFASSNKQLDKADRAIKELISENSKKKSVDNPAIRELSQAQEDRIARLQAKHFTEIVVEKRIGRIVISGISDDVSEAVMEVYEILKEQAEEKHTRKFAELVSKTVQWYYMEDGDEAEPYDDEINAKIEQAFMDNKTSIELNFAVDEYGKQQPYKIDFGSKTETNLATRNVARVVRKEHGTGTPLPTHWEPQPKDTNGKEKDVHLVQLDSVKQKQEYDVINNAITKTATAINIVKVERVQNPELYRVYMVKKQKMDDRNGSNEKKLFHGTPVNTCMLINYKGFNRSYCGKNATAFGKGVYFARDASYSIQPRYSPPDPSGSRCMYLASVLVGDYAQGSQATIAPPQKDPTNPTITYDSTVDNVATPTVFVAFHDNQVYPDYLITFK